MSIYEAGITDSIYTVYGNSSFSSYSNVNVHKSKFWENLNEIKKVTKINMNLLFAKYTLWISPGRTWPSSMLKLSYGPYTLVGIAEVKLQPCCTWYALENEIWLILNEGYNKILMKNGMLFVPEANFFWYMTSQSNHKQIRTVTEMLLISSMMIKIVQYIHRNTGTLIEPCLINVWFCLVLCPCPERSNQISLESDPSSLLRALHLALAYHNFRDGYIKIKIKIEKVTS